MNHQTNASEPGTLQETAAPESIFTGFVDKEPYEKKMKNARGWLYVVACLQLLMGVYEYFSAEENLVGVIAFGIDAFIAALFLVLALWSRKKPVPAFLAALICYITFAIGFMLLDSANIYKGLLVKILVVVALVKAYNSAREYVAIQSSLGGDI